MVLTTVVILAINLRGRPPRDDSAEAGFLRDMAVHHAQAAEMAFIVRDRSTDDDLRTLAYDIIVTQTAQRGVFMGWLQQWGLAQASAEPRMAWMNGHPHAASAASAVDAGGAALMPGMATNAEVDRLRQATGHDAEVYFLQLMIRHHEGGVEMARAILAQSTRDDVVTIARNIEATQAGEIATMTAMLAARGATPFTGAR
jgi:uncharacterized protein (DUF305 family)